jgi:hypothetical protein
MGSIRFRHAYISIFEWVLLGSEASLRKCAAFNIKVGAPEIHRKEIVRDLGYWIDSTLTFKSYFNKVCCKSFSALRLVNRLQRIISSVNYSMLVHSLVLSDVDYCLPVFYGVSMSSLCKLQSVLNAALRSVAGLKKCHHITEIRKQLGWLTLNERIHLRLAIIVFPIIKMGRPVDLEDMLHEYIPQREFCSSDKQLLRCPNVRTEMGKGAFSYYAPFIWNSLPENVKQARSIGSFTEWLKHHLNMWFFLFFVILCVLSIDPVFQKMCDNK